MYSRGKIAVHVFLLTYGLMLAYILSGLILNFSISADIFFDLSFALLIFAVAQAIYEIGIKYALVFIAITACIGYAAEVLGFGNQYRLFVWKILLY